MKPIANIQALFATPAKKSPTLSSTLESNLVHAVALISPENPTSTPKNANSRQNSPTTTLRKRNLAKKPHGKDDRLYIEEGVKREKPDKTKIIIYPYHGLNRSGFCLGCENLTIESPGNSFESRFCKRVTGGGNPIISFKKITDVAKCSQCPDYQTRKKVYRYFRTMSFIDCYQDDELE